MDSEPGKFGNQRNRKNCKVQRWDAGRDADAEERSIWEPWEVPRSEVVCALTLQG